MESFPFGGFGSDAGVASESGRPEPVHDDAGDLLPRLHKLVRADCTTRNDRLGDLAVAAGDSTGAEEHYRAGLTIAERLATTDPGNVQYQRDLSISHENLR